MAKVILDTNVLINGVQDENSRTFKIIQAAIAGDLTPVTSHKIRREYTLKASQLISDDEYLNLLEDFYESATDVRPSQRLRVVDGDPEDNKFVEAAAEASVEYIITDDHDLLDISTYGDTRMVSPEEFWNIYVEDIKGETSEEWQEWTRLAGFQ